VTSTCMHLERLTLIDGNTCEHSCRLSSPTKVGLFNARSVASSGKSQSISTWVSELKLTAAGQVETWHDGPDTPALVACAPPGYVCAERSRSRPDDKVDTNTMSTNHGGVSFTATGCTRESSTPHSTRHLNTAVFLHGSGLKSLFVVICRSGSAAAPSSFFDEFADLLDHVTSYSSVVIMGDVNLHLESPTDAGAVKFSSLLAMSNLVHQSPTHTAGHQLDVVVVRSDRPILW